MRKMSKKLFIIRVGLFDYKIKINLNGVLNCMMSVFCYLKVLLVLYLLIFKRVGFEL